MKTLVVVALAAMLAGCGQQDTGPGVADIHADCKVGGRPFVETWSCERVGIAGMLGYDDIKGVYLATGDFVVTQVKEGKMTDAEAKLTMAQARQQAATDSGNRARQEQATRPMPVMPPIQVFQPGAGQPPQPQIIYTPSGSVMCQRTGPTSVMCN